MKFATDVSIFTDIFEDVLASKNNIVKALFSFHNPWPRSSLHFLFWYGFSFLVLPLRSLRQGVAHMWRQAFEKEEDEHKKEHSESHLQRGHHLRHSARQYGPCQPAHLGHGLRFVRTNQTTNLVSRLSRAIIKLLKKSPPVLKYVFRALFLGTVEFKVCTKDFDFVTLTRLEPITNKRET